MNWWDSAESVSRFNFWMQLGIICFGVLTVAASAFSLIASRRMESLQKHEDKARQERLESAESATKQLQEDLTNANRTREASERQFTEKLTAAEASAQSATEQLAEEQRQKELAEEKRRTPPRLDASIYLTAPAKFLVIIKSENLIPFECQYLATTESNIVVTGLPLEWVRVFPTEGKRIFNGPLNVQLDRVKNGYIELRFDFRSLSAVELQLPGHSGKIIRKYRITPDGASITPLSN